MAGLRLPPLAMVVDLPQVQPRGLGLPVTVEAAAFENGSGGVSRWRAYSDQGLIRPQTRIEKKRDC